MIVAHVVSDVLAKIRTYAVSPARDNCQGMRLSIV